MGPERMNRDYEVGTKVFSVTDSSREEILGDRKGYRKITVRLYYPILKEQTEGKQKAPYVSEQKWEGMRKSYHITKPVDVSNEVDMYEDISFIDGQKFPLLLFSHGYTSYVEASTFLCSEIAARGYIVASVGHAHEAICTEYEDGSCDYFDKKINKMMYKKGVLRAVLAQLKLLKKKGTVEEFQKAFWQFENEHTPYIMERLIEWAKDMLFALEAVKEKFGQYIDFSHGVAASGHSLGGATAYYLCQTSDEITCGINIDGGLFGDYRGMTMKKPFYQIACRENWNVESAVLLNTQAPVYTAVFQNMRHIGFTDVKFFCPIKMVVGKMDAEKMHKHLTDCHTTFLDKYMKGLDVEIHQSKDEEIKTDVYA